jgi:hypothetical protein
MHETVHMILENSIQQGNQLGHDHGMHHGRQRSRHAERGSGCTTQLLFLGVGDTCSACSIEAQLRYLRVHGPYSRWTVSTQGKGDKLVALAHAAVLIPDHQLTGQYSRTGYVLICLPCSGTSAKEHHRDDKQTCAPISPVFESDSWKPELMCDLWSSRKSPSWGCCTSCRRLAQQHCAQTDLCKWLAIG